MCVVAVCLSCVEKKDRERELLRLCEKWCYDVWTQEEKENKRIVSKCQALEQGATNQRTALLFPD